MLILAAGLLVQIPTLSAQESAGTAAEDAADTLDPHRAAEQNLRFGEAAAPADPNTGVSVWVIIRMILVLVLAAAAVYGVVFLFKRVSRKAPEEDPYLKVLAAAHLGSNRYAHIISVGNRAWLIGSGESSVHLISEIDDKDIIDTMLQDDSQKKNMAKQGVFPDFAALLRRAGTKVKANPAGAEQIRKRRERLNGL